MSLKIAFAAILAGALLSSCASTSISQLARNRALVSTSAAPICGTQGATTVANQMAAIATIRQGFERFIITGAGAQNNTQVVTTGPTYATTTGTFNRYGNVGYGSARTTYGGQMTFVRGSNDAQMEVVMLNRGDPGYDEGLDARRTLGPEWQKKVSEGIADCFE